MLVFESEGQIVIVSGKLCCGCPKAVVVGVNVTLPAAAILIAACANATVAVRLGAWRIPSPVDVAAIDTMSGSGALLAVRRKVFSPGTIAAGAVLVQVNVSGMSSENAAVGVIAK